jgi:hypothetical protein
LRILLHSGRHADAPRLSKPFQTRRHVHAVSEDVIAIDDDVPHVDTYAELDPLLRGHLGVTLDHPSLDLDSTAQGIHNAGELDQHAVPGGLHDPAAVLANLGVNQRAPIGTDGVPMLVFFSTCKACIRTIPQLQHDPLKAEDVAEGADHAADAVRYACMARPWLRSTRPDETLLDDGYSTREPRSPGMADEDADWVRSSVLTL